MRSYKTLDDLFEQVEFFVDAVSDLSLIHIFLYLYFMNLYIGNLSYNVKESDLRNVMEEYGTVASVKLISDRETRRSIGFAFVEMPDDAEANNVIKQLNGAEYVGRSMAVSYTHLPSVHFSILSLEFCNRF